MVALESAHPVAIFMVRGISLRCGFSPVDVSAAFLFHENIPHSMRFFFESNPYGAPTGMT